MDLEAAAERQWVSLKKSMQGSRLSLHAKIDGIERYLFQNDTSRYAAEAREILKSLQKETDIHSTEREQTVKTIGSEEKAKKEAEEHDAALVKRQAELDRGQCCGGSKNRSHVVSS